jgi:hypothetical protein
MMWIHNILMIAPTQREQQDIQPLVGQRHVRSSKCWNHLYTSGFQASSVEDPDLGISLKLILTQEIRAVGILAYEPRHAETSPARKPRPESSRIRGKPRHPLVPTT